MPVCSLRLQVRGLYKGMTSPLMGVPPIYAIVFGAYGQAKKLFQKDPNDTLTLSQIFYAGCITGIATTVSTLNFLRPIVLN